MRILERANTFTMERLLGIREERDPSIKVMLTERYSGPIGSRIFSDCDVWESQERFARVLRVNVDDETALTGLLGQAWGEVVTGESGKREVVFRYVRTVDGVRFARERIAAIEAEMDARRTPDLI